ncbi:MAG: hypothetical protein GX032_03265 [Tenericutes bacterium]|nr:hypothetical protein [Mycoplasmatota bacterium]
MSTESKNYILEKLPGNFGYLYSTEKLFVANYKGKEFYIINTPINIFEYENMVKKIGLYEGGGNGQGSQCLLISQMYATDLTKGKVRTQSEFSNPNDSPAVYFHHNIMSEDIEVVKAGLFNGIQNGHPMVLQVSAKNVDRHFVTVLGFTTDVKNSSQISEDNIIVLDNAYGEIKILSETGRVFENDGGKYRVMGPTDKYLIQIASIK